MCNGFYQKRGKTQTKKLMKEKKKNALCFPPINSEVKRVTNVAMEIKHQR